MVKIASNGRYLLAPTLHGEVFVFNILSGRVTAILKDHDGMLQATSSNEILSSKVKRRVFTDCWSINDRFRSARRGFPSVPTAAFHQC